MSATARDSTVSALAAAIRAGQRSAVDAVTEAFERIDALNPQVNAVVTTDREGAIADADRLDAVFLDRGVVGPLHGVPFTVKDTLETAGMRTTAGAREFAEHIPTRDAPAVARLRDAGMVVVGKTNVPKLAGDYQTCNHLFGTTRNPWDLDRSPGGSSGGSAAAVAAGMSLADVASDTAGSLMLPAHYTGVYAHKPTFGVVPTLGHIPPRPGSRTERDMIVVGPLARSVDDLELLLEALWRRPAESGWALRPLAEPSDPSTLRVGVWFDAPGAAVDDAIREVLASAADRLDDAGARLVDSSGPMIDVEQAKRVATLLVAATASGSLGPERFNDIVRIGDAVGDDAADYLALMARGTSHRHRAWLELIEWREAYREEWTRYFSGIDLLLCPIGPVTAMRHALDTPRADRTISVNGVAEPYYSQIVWPSLVSLAGLPATAVPAGVALDGLPVGLQIVGPKFADRRCLTFARFAAGALATEVPDLLSSTPSK